MKLLTKIELNIDKNHKINIHKFFQVVFVKILSGSPDAHVDFYSALVYSSSNKTSSSETLRIETNINRETPVEIRDVGREFYNEIDILQQFWGEDSKALKKTEEVVEWAKERCNDVTPEIENFIRDKIPPDISGANCLLGIYQKDKGIGPLIVIPEIVDPFSINHQMNAMNIFKLDPAFDDIDLTVANGIWIHERFKSTPLLHEGVLLLSHELRTQGLLSNDFRVYYSFPSTSKVEYQNGRIDCISGRADIRATNNQEVEIVQLYSQDCRNYYPEWVKNLGIKDSTLFRIEPNAKYEDSFREGKVLLCKIRMNIIIGKLKESLRMTWLLSSIWLAAAMAFGLDYSRSIATKGYFPHFDIVDPSFIWIIMCILVIPVFLLNQISINLKFTRIAFYLSLTCFILWFGICYLISVETRSHISVDFIKYIPLAQILLGVTGLITGGFFSRMIDKYRNKL